MSEMMWEEDKKNQAYYESLKNAYIENAEEDLRFAELFVGVSHEADQLVIKERE